MQELINLAGKVRGNLVLLHGIYRVDIPVSNVRCGTNSCLNSMQAENEKCSGESTSEVSANDADQVGGPRQFWQTTRVVTKNDSCLSFMTNDFRRTTSQLAVPRCAPRFRQCEGRLALPSTQAWRTEIMKHNSNCVWNVSSSVRSTYTQDGAVLLDVKKGACYSMNVVAARVWTAMERSQEGITLTDIVNALEEHFQVPRERLESDTAECLENLRRLGLVSQNDKKLSASASSGGA